MFKPNICDRCNTNKINVYNGTYFKDNAGILHNVCDKCSDEINKEVQNEI